MIILEKDEKFGRLGKLFRPRTPDTSRERAITRANPSTKLSPQYSRDRNKGVFWRERTRRL